MSGFCEFCGIWHSASCCHPGRKILDEKNQQIATLQEQIGAINERLEAWRDYWRNDEDETIWTPRLRKLQELGEID